MDPSTTNNLGIITTTTTATTIIQPTLVVDRKYHPKRPHRKSRKGCRNCKARRVKCDEKKPSCHSCTARNSTCVYPALTPSKTAPSHSASSPPSISQIHAQSLLLLQEPLFIPRGRDEVDMRLLWFYTTATFKSFSSGPWPDRNVDKVLRVDVVRHAFVSPFLMDCLFALSAMHINKLGYREINVPPSKELLYRARAYEGFRKAVDAADPATFPALLACSLLLCGLSTYVFRLDEPRPLYTLDWITLWRGVSSIVRMAGARSLAPSGLLPWMFRPEVDLEQSARHVPSNLVLMLASIKEDTNPEAEDFRYIESYALALKVLGSLYRELASGFGPMLHLRIGTYFTFLDRDFHEAASKRRGPALVIIAHYLAFTNFNGDRCWWMEGIGDQEIPNIYDYVESEWRPFLQVPMATVGARSKVEIARLLLNDPFWGPCERQIKKEECEEDGGCVLGSASNSGVAPSGPDQFDMTMLGEECIKLERDMNHGAIITELAEE